jgi:hypothetical protein
MYIFPTVLAQIQNLAVPGIGTNPRSFLQNFLSTLISFGFVVGGVVFLFMLILGGIQWITSGGDKIANENARKRVSNALIGIFVLFSVYGILNLVGCFFRTDFLTITVDRYSIGFGVLNCN